MVLTTQGGARCLAAIAMALLAGGAAPASVGAQAGTTLAVAQAAAMSALDPVVPSTGSPSRPLSSAESEAAFLIYDGLVRFTDEMSIVPELAASWNVDPDGRAWTFKIRRGVTFQDGTPLIAQAVVANLDRVINPATNTSSRTLWDPIDSVSALDAATVRVRTKVPYGALLNTLAQGSALIASPAAIERWGAEYRLHPVGTGPYAVDRWDLGTRLDLARHRRYWDGRPGFDRIVLRAVPDPATRVTLLRSGQAQVADGIPPGSVDELRRAPGVTVIVRPALRTFGMGINLNRPTLQDIRVRQALNYAVNKQLLVQALFRGHAAVLRSPLAPRTSGYAEVAAWPYDPPKARMLLETAGWKPAPPIGVRVKDGRSLQITLLTPQGAFPRDVEVVETLADYLRNVGFEPHFTYVEPAALPDHLLVPPDQSKWDLAFFGFSPSNGDGGSHLDALYRSNPDRQHRPPAWNFTWYSNPQVDAWLAEGARSLDPRVRDAAYAKAERQVWTDAPSLWLFADSVIVATREAQGVEVLPIAFTILKHAHP
ncbi:MAG TPA: ABC transporter substrate-binding protein [bacterium]|nr:ABC transporter substrate-binding protein [bacterium]